MFELVRQSFSKAPRVGILDYDWLNPIDLGISSYHLFLNFLLQLTRNGSPFPESHPISHLTVKLFRIIYILSSSLLRPVAHLPIWGTPFANVWQKVRMRVWHRVALLFLLPAWIRTMKKLQSCEASLKCLRRRRLVCSWLILLVNAAGSSKERNGDKYRQKDGEELDILKAQNRRLPFGIKVSCPVVRPP